MKPQPVLIEPRFVQRIWGVRSLEPLFPEKRELAEPIGEVWLTGDDCVFASGPFAGKKVAEAWEAMPPEWAGTRMNTQQSFPLLLKFLFPAEKLSVQVHPDDDYARAHEAAKGGVGKTETWHVISAQPGAEVMVGLKPGVTRESFRRAIAEGTAESCMVRVAAECGDQIFVPAGTMHTIGPGMVLCEIQENSDVTYRVFDYNRLTAEGKPRELHIEKALEVARFGEQLGGKTQPVRIAQGQLEETYCVACRYFAVEKWAFGGRIGGVTQPERFELLVFLEGSGQVQWSHEATTYEPAQVWMLPAGLGAYQLEPAKPTTLLRAFVPDIEQDFVSRLRERKIPQSSISRIVFS